jgi:hypothetical protein
LISAPEKQSASRRLAYDATLSTRPEESPLAAAWQVRKNRAGQIVGFELSNHGANSIPPPRRDLSKSRLFARDFQLRFDERARQDIHLFVADYASSRP